MSLNELFPRRLRRAALALAAAAVLGACGGGDRAEPFSPQRIVALGDELSVITPEGAKYGVNAVSSTDASKLDCATYPLWIQSVAGQFGMFFAECRGTATGNPTAFIRATLNAKVAQLKDQVDSYLANDNPVENELVTVLVGSHDVLEVYASWAQSARTQADEDQALQAIRDRAAELAAQVKRIIDKGPAVLLSTIPDLGYSPYAAAREAAVPGTQNMLRKLSLAFNAGMVSAGVGSSPTKGLAYYGFTGRDYALVQAGTSWISAVAGGSKAGEYNTTPMCPQSGTDQVNDNVVQCRADALVTNADVNAWVWADNLRPGPVFQTQMGSRAMRLSGSNGNPF